MATLPRTLHDFHDTTATRKRIFEKVTAAFQDAFPKKGRHTTVEVSNLSIPSKEYSIADQKKHILEGRDLTVPLKGTLKLRDNDSGKVIEERTQTLAQVPYYTGRGTFISNGNDFATVNQFRLNPGVYTRWKDNGDLEAHFNLQHGSGLSFRSFLEPKTGVFRLNVGQANLKLYPILRAMGVRHGDIESAWGKDIAAINQHAGKDMSTVKKLYSKIAGWRANPNLSIPEQGQEITKELAKARMDPSVNRVTLKGDFDRVTPRVFLKATSKLLDINKGKDRVDDRDSVAFRRVFDVADYMSEKVRKDAGNIRKKVLSKVDRERSLKAITPGIFTRQVKGAVLTDSKIQPVEEVNPVELFDYQERIVSLGEGGISSVEAVPEEARNVHPSQLNSIDPVRGPESMTVGVDVRAAYNTFKGDDGRLYSSVLNKRGQRTLIPADKLARAVVAFPGQYGKRGSGIKVIDKKGTLRDASDKEVEYWLPHGQGMFSHVANLIPGIGSTEGRRLLMGSKFQTQALPLETPEHPIVMNKVPGTDIPFERLIGMKIGGRPAKVGGRVTKVTPNDIYIKGADGKSVRHGVYNNFSFNRKSYIHQTPIVKPGDVVRRGQPLAKSTFTDKEGNLALGRNLVTAYMPFKGYSVEDGIVVSESASKKLTTDLMYSVNQPVDKEVELGKSKYVTGMPTTFTKPQLANLDNEGVIKPGTTIKKGDPIILALHKRPLSATDIVLGKLHKSLRNFYSDKSHVWDHDTDGTVTDVAKTKKGYKVTIKTKSPLVESDKIANRFGGKGVIGKILPDDQMPVIESMGKRVEVLLNPLGVPSRINPMQVFETLLGKVSEKTGKPYLVEPFSDESRVDFVKRELKKHGVSEQEWLVDPSTGKRYKNPILVGKQFFTKSFKTSESGFSARELGSYTAEERPAKGGKEGAKKIGGMLISALLAHGATNNLREMSTIKGTKNREFWKAMRLGLPLPSPEVPFIYKKFEAYLKGAGANVEKFGHDTRIQPLTQQGVDAIAGLPVKNDRLLKAKDLSPEKGGLFDFAITGGPSGQRWSHIPLVEPMPNPAMEEPIRRMLGLTQKKYESILSGKEQFEGATGPKAIANGLKALNIDTEFNRAKAEIKSGKRSIRDDAVKRLQYHTMFKKTGIKPADLVLDKWPVLPPQFRPIAVSGAGNTVVVSSPNLLYKDLIQANSTLGDLKKDLLEEDTTEEDWGFIRH